MLRVVAPRVGFAPSCRVSGVLGRDATPAPDPLPLDRLFRRRIPPQHVPRGCLPRGVTTGALDDARRTWAGRHNNNVGREHHGPPPPAAFNREPPPAHARRRRARIVLCGDALVQSAPQREPRRGGSSLRPSGGNCLHLLRRMGNPTLLPRKAQGTRAPAARRPTRPLTPSAPSSPPACARPSSSRRSR